MSLRIVIAGLSITSSWGNGHATTYRALVRALHRRGHEVVFLERNLSWYADNRDLPVPPYGRTIIYNNISGLRAFDDEVRRADLVIVGSYVPQGAQVLDWALQKAGGLIAFYDLDTPVTLARLAKGDTPPAMYIAGEQIPQLDVYLSFTGGSTLRRIEHEFGAPLARPFYCSVDTELYFPQRSAARWELGYLGTYSPDRQLTLDRLLVGVARRWPQGRFIVAGPQYPKNIVWPHNVERVNHLSPQKHRPFYNAQAFTLNVTRADMITAGFSPSVRLFEAAACGIPVISDEWPGLESFFEPGVEILVAHSTGEALDQVRHTPEKARITIGAAARRRCLAHHTSEKRVLELEQLVHAIRGSRTFAVPAAPRDISRVV